MKDVIAEITAENLDLKKNVLALEDHGQVPPELQQEVHAVVKQTKERSEWPAKKTLAALGIPRGSYYRWLQEEAWAREQKETPRSVQPFEALEEERQAVLKYAREHAAIRHRELAWKIIDDNAAYLSPSTVYRILREENLMCRQWGGRRGTGRKRRRPSGLMRFGGRT